MSLIRVDKITGKSGTDNAAPITFSGDVISIDQPGHILQVVNNSTTSTITPGISYNSLISKEITGVLASSKILVSYDFKVGSDGGNWRKTRLQRSINSGSYSSVTNGFAMEYAGNTQSDSQMTTVSLEFLDTPSYSLGQTVAYKVQVETGGSTFKMNAPSNQSSAYGISTITLYEVAT